MNFMQKSNFIRRTLRYVLFEETAKYLPKTVLSVPVVKLYLPALYRRKAAQYQNTAVFIENGQKTTFYVIHSILYFKRLVHFTHNSGRHTRFVEADIYGVEHIVHSNSVYLLYPIFKVVQFAAVDKFLSI